MVKVQGWTRVSDVSEGKAKFKCKYCDFMRSVITTKKGTACSGVMGDHIRKVHPEKLAEAGKGASQAKRLNSCVTSVTSYLPPKKWARTDARSQKCDGG